MKIVLRWDPQYYRALLLCTRFTVCVCVLQSLLKKHEAVMADVDFYQVTMKSLAEQSEKCKV